MGLNFIDVVGVGKNACSIRSKSRLSKLFVADGRGVLRGVVRACGVTQEGAAAVGSTMVEGGIGHRST